MTLELERTTVPPEVPEEPGTSRLVTGVSLACVVAVLARVTVHAAEPVSNTDTWFHLRIGRELLGSWSLREPGQLSSFADTPWLPTQWSVQVAAAQAEAWFGLPGVAWLFGVVYVALVLAVYAVCRREGDPLGAGIATVLAVVATAPAVSTRPQVVTLLLLTVVVGAWLRAERTGSVPWLLVPLTWVWATAHGLWTFGVVVGVACCVGLVLDHRVDRRQAMRMSAVPLLSLVAGCLTPLGPRLLLTQVAVGSRADQIAEWGATSFRSIPAFTFAVLAALVVLLWSRRGQVSWTRLLLLGVACGAAILVMRMVACSAVLLAPLLAGELHRLVTRRPAGRMPRHERVVLAAAAAVALGVLALVVPDTAARPAGVPVAFEARLAALPSGSAVAVEDGTGAWIEWRLPHLDPVIDGMLDAYSEEHIDRWRDFVAVAPGWQDFVAESGAEVAVVQAGTPLSEALQERLGWRVEQRSGEWVYVVAPSSRRPVS